MQKLYITFLGIILSSHILAQNCQPTFIPDLALITSPASIQAEIDAIYNIAKERTLKSSPPSTENVDDAIATYDNLNIVVNGNTITANTITSYNDVSFIGVFADHLKYNPTDIAMIERARNTIWWVYESLCNETLSSDYPGYKFRNFMKKGVYCIELLDSIDKERLLYILEKNSNDWNVFWIPDYDEDYQAENGAINTDFIHNTLFNLIPVVKCFETEDEQYRYMLTLKRYVNRFITTYTNGTLDGLKADGSGYHHNNNYEAYMYAYNGVVATLKTLDNTSFQVDASTYLVLRDAVLHKLLIFNDSGFAPLCITGRTGNWDSMTFSQSSLRDLAIIGGNILGLATADPILAGIYNRRYEIEPEFNYDIVSPFENGFYQNNHASAGIFRTNNTILVNKGFNNQLWGAEIYTTSNRYGRYQSYGALAVVYPGDREMNGFDQTNWDWNYNPGATTKVLPWEKLIAGWNRIDEYSDKRFAGALQFGLKNNGILNNTFGTYGMFAMDFKEKINMGWSGSVFPETHDSTFTFKKSTFFFDDVIICLATDINNTDTNYPTVTTLYQDVTTPGDVIINNETYSLTETISNYSGLNDNWLLDNFGTGYYIVNGSGDLKAQRKDQQTPSQNQTDPTILNPSSQAAIGFIDHGFAPSDAAYEYVIVPNANLSNMQSLASSFQSADTKPYEIINKDDNSHIIQHKATGIFGFALFQENISLPENTNIQSNDFPCLIMYQPNTDNTEMKLSLSNPDLGLSTRKTPEPFTNDTIRITLNGNWSLSNPHSNIIFISSDENNSIYDFVTYQGLPIEANFIFEEPLSNETPSDESSIVIFPNPSKDKIYIKANTPLNWKIFNIEGKEVMKGEESLQYFSIDINSLKAGTYLLSTENGKSLKFIKN